MKNTCPKSNRFDQARQNADYDKSHSLIMAFHFYFLTQGIHNFRLTCNVRRNFTLRSNLRAADGGFMIITLYKTTWARPGLWIINFISVCCRAIAFIASETHGPMDWLAIFMCETISSLISYSLLWRNFICNIRIGCNNRRVIGDTELSKVKLQSFN